VSAWSLRRPRDGGLAGVGLPESDEPRSRRTFSDTGNSKMIPVGPLVLSEGQRLACSSSGRSAGWAHPGVVAGAATVPLRLRRRSRRMVQALARKKKKIKAAVLEEGESHDLFRRYDSKLSMHPSVT